MYYTVKEAIFRAVEERKPALIEAMTFRMRGHEEASGIAYVPEEKLMEWAGKDPVKQFEDYLIDGGIADRETLDKLRIQAKEEFVNPLKKALDAELEKARVYAPVSQDSSVSQDSPGTSYSPDTPDSPDTHHSPKPVFPSRGGEELRFIDSIRCAQQDAFDKDELIMIGQDIAAYGGVFKVTQGFLERYGRDRVRNTPVIESGALGTALGLAYEGFRLVVEIQFADFVSCGFNQIVNNIAKSHYRWSPPVNVTIRLPHGAGKHLTGSRLDGRVPAFERSSTTASILNSIPPDFINHKILKR